VVIASLSITVFSIIAVKIHKKRKLAKQRAIAERKKREATSEKLTAMIGTARDLLSAGDWLKAIKKAKAAINHAANAGLNDRIAEAEILVKEINESWTRSIRERVSRASEMLEAGDFQGAQDLANQLLHEADDGDLVDAQQELNRFLGEVNDSWLRSLKDRLAQVDVLSRSGEFSKVTSLIKDLRREALVGGFSDVVSLLDKMHDSVKNAWHSSLQSRAGAVSRMLESGDFSGAASFLSSLESEARKAGFDDLASGFKERGETAGMLQKLSSMLRSSTRLRIDDVSSLLGMERVALLSILLDWSGRMGFKIDGDYIVTSEGMDVGAFIADLDRQFSEWSESEKDKRGKI
ncbi:MAG: hypothetical protein ACTSRA_21425, partial [Promethearchaeota archaeon]